MDDQLSAYPINQIGGPPVLPTIPDAYAQTMRPGGMNPADVGITPAGPGHQPIEAAHADSSLTSGIVAEIGGQIRGILHLQPADPFWHRVVVWLVIALVFFVGVWSLTKS